MPPARAHPLLRFVRITVGYEEAFGEVGSVNAVVERLNHYSLERIVEVISRITLITAYYSGEDHAKGQAHVAAALFGKSVLQQIMRAVAARRGTKLDWKNAVLFHERQTLNLLKIALLSMPVDQPGAADDSLRPLGEALLMVNDLLDQGVVDSDPLDTDRKRAFELYLFANVFFNQSTSELASLTRAYEFFFSEHPGLPGCSDLRSRLERATGVDPDLLWWGLRALHAYFFVRKPDEIDAAPAVINRYSLLDGFRIPKADADRLIDTAVIDAAALKAEVESRYELDDLRPFDVLTFARHPLVSFEERAYCVSLPLLHELAGMGIQHRLLDQSVFTEVERGEFLQCRGRIFEDYVQRLLKRTFGNARYIGEMDLKDTARGRKSCDAAVLYGDAVLLFEVKAAIAPLAAKAAESWTAYEAAVTQAFIRSAEQLDGTIRLAEAGALRGLGIDPAIVKRYVPVAVTLDLLVAPLTYYWLLEHLKSAGTLTNGKALPLQILDVGELELVETAVANGRSALDLFERKARNREWLGLSFRNFCNLINEEWLDEHNPYLKERFLDLSRRFEDLTEQFAKKAG